MKLVDVDIINTHIALLEARAEAHRMRMAAGEGPYQDSVFLGYALGAEGGVQALRAVLDEAKARCVEDPVGDAHVTDGPCWCDPEVIAVPATEHRMITVDPATRNGQPCRYLVALDGAIRHPLIREDADRLAAELDRLYAAVEK